MARRITECRPVGVSEAAEFALVTPLPTDELKGEWPLQLLLHPSTTQRLTGNFRYKLWVKFEVTAEERSLITKYSVQRTILWRGRALRDFARAVLWGTIPALIISGFLVNHLERRAWQGLAVVIPLIVWNFIVWVIYHQIREEVRVSDVLVGRVFSSPSVVAL